MGTLDSPTLVDALSYEREAEADESTEKFKEEERFDRTLRTYGGPEDFPKDAGGNPIDFQTRIHRDIMRRASEKILCGKTITPVEAHEVYGDPRWHSGGLDLG